MDTNKYLRVSFHPQHNYDEQIMYEAMKRSWDGYESILPIPSRKIVIKEDQNSFLLWAEKTTYQSRIVEEMDNFHDANNYHHEVIYTSTHKNDDSHGQKHQPCSANPIPTWDSRPATGTPYPRDCPTTSTIPPTPDSIRQFIDEMENNRMDVDPTEEFKRLHVIDKHPIIIDLTKL